MDKKGAILVLSGPSGSGKSSMCKKLFEVFDNYYFSISTTTRSPRDGEEDGKDYFFVTKDEFLEDIKNGEFLEWAEVHGNFYGTSLKPVKKSLEEGKLVIFDIDVQGHESVREKFDEITTSFFITTPTLSELRNRLEGRGTDSKETIDKRLINALHEMEKIDSYDFFLVNENLDHSSDVLISIAKSALSKSALFNKDEIISSWNK